MSAEIRVTKMEQHEDEGRPYFTANVHRNGSHIEACNRYGSWLTADGRREVLPGVAAILQRKLPREYRARR